MIKRLEVISKTEATELHPLGPRPRYINYEGFKYSKKVAYATFRKDMEVWKELQLNKKLYTIKHRSGVKLLLNSRHDFDVNEERMTANLIITTVL